MRVVVFAVVCSVVFGASGPAAAADLPDVGTFLAVEGTVTMQPASMTAPRPVRAYEPIGPLAVIETAAASRTKVLFIDDTLIALGEQSRLEVTEQTYRPGSDTRTFVAHLTRGTARVLVGKPLADEQSVFEIHSRTAVVTARGTYFLVWIAEPPRPQPAPRTGTAPRSLPLESEDEGATGVANIGQRGDIALTSGGATVLLLPGQSSIALPGGPPSMPMAIESFGEARPVAAALAATAVPDIPKRESPRQVLAAVGMGEDGSLSPVPAEAGWVGGQTSAGAYAIPGWPIPVTPVTPPAVVSGAAPASVNPAAGTNVNITIRVP